MRTTDRILAIMLGLAGFVFGILVICEVVYSQVGNVGHLVIPYEPVASFLREHRWKDVLVIVIGCIVALAGLLLLVAEVRRRRPDLSVLRGRRDDVLTAMSNRSVGRAITAAVDQVPGISSSATAVRRNRISVTARTGLRDPRDLESSVTAAATDAVRDLDLIGAPRLRVRVAHLRGSS